MDFSSIERALWVALLCAQALLCLLMWQRHLLSRFPLFFSYLLLEVVTGLVLIQIPRKAIAYAIVFSWYATCVSILRWGVIAELFVRLFREFNGRSGNEFRDLVGGASLTLGAFIGMTSILPERGLLHWAWPHTPAMVLRQWQGIAFAVGLIGVWIVLRYALDVSKYISRDILWHWRILTVFLAASGLNSMAVLLTRSENQIYQIDIAMLAIDLLCCFAWIRTMRHYAPRPRPVMSPEEIERIHAAEHEWTAKFIRRLPGDVEGRRGPS